MRNGSVTGWPLGVLLALAVADRPAAAQELALVPSPASVAPTTPIPALGERSYPINLPTALHWLANANPSTSPWRRQRIQVAAAQLERARVLWLPTHLPGRGLLPPRRPDSGRGRQRLRHQQELAHGRGRARLRSSPSPTPSSARWPPGRTSGAGEAAWQTAANDSLLAVAEAYFNVQQARGELAGAEDAARRAEDLVDAGRPSWRQGPGAARRGRPRPHRAGPPPAGRRRRPRALADRQRRPGPRPAPGRRRPGRAPGAAAPAGHADPARPFRGRPDPRRP